VAKQRIVNTKFWDDSYIVRLSPSEKLLFLYLITNPLTNISGVYELPLRRVAFDTGIPADKVGAILKKLEEDGKLVAADGWVGMVNFIKHQALNPKIKQGILTELKRAPKSITNRLSIDYQTLCVGVGSSSDSNSNLNPNLNSNSNARPIGKLSTTLPQELQEKHKELISKWRM
jgi:hypothetical protein